ncbi:MAG: cold shock domain-containing protein [Rhodocyclaceae bacterium]|nr:cold shock domain-containing protein [Rhodocyclaceae bacterium]MCP5233978.1 cold shock domain-containing protein [Zoogloeaceae bacterium]MCP5237020.1 cold shock domain-containing protein [Zoogloeaceae bacterium]
MPMEGRLSKWNDQRGFGFITPEHGDGEVFVHISAFPRDGVRPTPGELLSFEIEIDSSGRRRARKVACPQRVAAARPSSRQRTGRLRRGAGRGIRGRVVALLIVGSLGIFAYDEYSRGGWPASLPVRMPDSAKSPSPYRCDGRTHCSQMTSCAEATYFLRNCPGVGMDGNHDGVPCQQQWCTSPFAD